VRNRGYAFVYVVAVFFLLPLGTVFGTRNLDIDYDPPVPQRLEDALPPAEAAPDAVGDTTRQKRLTYSIRNGEPDPTIQRISFDRSSASWTKLRQRDDESKLVPPAPPRGSVETSMERRSIRP
jgi:hypothetical protein